MVQSAALREGGSVSVLDGERNRKVSAAAAVAAAPPLRERTGRASSSPRASRDTGASHVATTSEGQRAGGAARVLTRRLPLRLRGLGVGDSWRAARSAGASAAAAQRLVATRRPLARAGTGAGERLRLALDVCARTALGCAARGDAAAPRVVRAPAAASSLTALPAMRLPGVGALGGFRGLAGSALSDCADADSDSSDSSGSDWGAAMGAGLRVTRRRSLAVSDGVRCVARFGGGAGEAGGLRGAPSTERVSERTRLAAHCSGCDTPPCCTGGTAPRRAFVGGAAAGSGLSSDAALLHVSLSESAMSTVSTCADSRSTRFRPRRLNLPHL